MPSGRRLILVFVAGVLATSLLFALPLLTIRDRVISLEEAEGERLAALNTTTGEQLLTAGTLVRNATLSPEGATQVAKASAHVASAKAMVNLTSPEDVQAAVALEQTSRVLDQLSGAIACELVPRDAPALRAVPMLAQSLLATGQRLVDHERVGYAQLDGTSRTLDESLTRWIETRGRLANATLENGTDTEVTVRLAGPIPGEGCRRSLEIEVCRVAESTEGCVTVEGTDGLFEVTGPREVTVPAPSPTEGTEHYRVTVSDTQLGIASSSSCQLAPVDGASCR